ncbi:MAG: M20 family peptidase [Cyclobacteriaceae bacterium]|nr:M20 family peptidase [Cyclobacteriaceae bacterium]
MKQLKKIGLLLLGILFFFIIYLVVNTINFKTTQVKYESIDVLEINSSSVDNFSAALKIKTISPENAVDFDSIQFHNFSDFLENTYPLTNSLLEKKTFNTFSFLYKWEGTESSLKPIVLMAHLDVVPVIEENLSDWKEDPFGGKVVNDTIWGRGTIDDKIGVIGIMESIELLLKQGFVPKRSIYIALGHDEEIGGLNGAKVIANYLKEEGVEAEFVLDEGGVIIQDRIPGIKKDVALIGIAEKGFVSLKLSVKLEGGHSSMPEKETAIDVLANAITKLKKNPFPTKITPPLEKFIENLGPEMPFMNKLVFANKFIFSTLIKKIYEESASGNANVRTTTSPTIFNSGAKENIIPRSAHATINFRVLPEETIASVIERVKEAINDDRIQINSSEFDSEPSQVSSITSFGYATISKTISEINPELLIAPYLVVGATDSRYFNEVSKNIYRFSFITINDKNIKSFHGVNERLPIVDFENAIRFYHQLIKNSDMK